MGLGTRLYKPHTNQYYEKIAAPMCTCVCMYVCVYALYGRYVVHVHVLITQAQSHARIAPRNNAGGIGKGLQRTARVNSKYGSPNLLRGPRMYSKLVSETEQLIRDLDNTDKG